MSEHSTALLNWAGKGYDCMRFDDGWAVIETASKKQSQLWADSEPIAPHESAIAIVGQRTAALRALKTLLPRKANLVYADLPRLGYFKPEDSDVELSTWLTLAESHIKESFNLLAESGFIAVHVDEPGAAYARALLDDLLGPERHCATALWQKKYAPQNDLRGRIDDAQDFIFVYSRQPGNPKGRFATTWWPYELAGKTEDATRQFEKLRDEGIISLPTIPKTSKPQKLLSLIIEKLTAPDDYVVELFSDTGFASIAALRCGRVPIYLVGETQEEKDVFKKCGKPAIQHALHDMPARRRRLAVREIGADRAPKRVRLNIKQNPVVYAPARKEDDLVEQSVLVRPLLLKKGPGIALEQPGFPSSFAVGPAQSVLAALEPVVRCEARLAWCDLSQTGIGHAQVRPLVEKFPPLLQADGIMAIKVDDDSYAAVRLVCNALFGRQQHVGTISLQIAESAAADHAFIVAYRALPPKRLKKVGLPATHEFENGDGDPRGPWRDPGHKGARSGGKGTAFGIRIPPYRWELVEGKLPPGCWRINPYTGVIYSCRLEKAGSFDFTVKVSDSSGRTSTAVCNIQVRREGNADLPDDVWFLSKGSLRKTASAPRVSSISLPDGVEGQKYSCVLEASGGDPFDDVKLPGKETPDGKRTRYWEFNRATLMQGLLEDRVNFGAKGMSSPSFKVYEKRAAGRGTSVELSWWDKARVGDSGTTARLLQMFTKEDDLVVSLAPSPLDAAEGRRIVQCIEHETDLPSNAVNRIVAILGEPVAKFEIATRRFELAYDMPEFRQSLAWAEGFLPTDHNLHLAGLPAEAQALVHGVTSDHEEAFHMLPADGWLTTSVFENLAFVLGNRFRRVHVYYFRGDPPGAVKGLAFHRIPFALNCRPKG